MKLRLLASACLLAYLPTAAHAEDASTDTADKAFTLGQILVTSDRAPESDVTIGSGTLDFSDFAFTIGSGFPTTGGPIVYTLFDTNSSINGTLASTGLTGSLGGTKTGTLSISENGQDVLLTVNVPEPTSMAAVAIASAGMLGRRRRK